MDGKQGRINGLDRRERKAYSHNLLKIEQGVRSLAETEWPEDVPLGRGKRGPGSDPNKNGQQTAVDEDQILGLEVVTQQLLTGDVIKRCERIKSCT